MPPARPRAAPAVLLALLGLACRTPDPRQEVELRDLEGYWAVDPAVGETRYLAPVVRSKLYNKAAEAWSIQAMATFRREGDDQTWSASAIVSPIKDRPLEKGQSALVVLKPEGEGRYTYRGEVTDMLKHEAFKDFTATVFVKVGRSSWTRFADVKIERRLGTHAVDTFQ